MAHQHFHTDSIVLKTLPHGEVSKTVLLFTRQLGLIYARAQGVRKITAKLHAHLQELTLSKVSLVRGRATWRIIGVDSLVRVKNDNRRERALKARLASLIERFVGIGMEQEKLFVECEAIWQYVESENLTTEEYDYIEVLAVLRILHNLGYFDGGETFGRLLAAGQYNREILKEILPLKLEAIALINASFAHSQL